MPKAQIKIPYTPQSLQKQVHDCPALFRVIVAHRRFGKTVLAINEIIRCALTKPGRYWYVGPTYRQAKTVALDLMKKYLPRETIVKANEHELIFKLFNGSEIALKGSENKDSLRGVGLKGVVLDEFELMDRDVWEAILGPTLMDNKNDPGWALFLGTPQGRNYFQELYLRSGKLEFPDWKSFHFSVYETDVFKPEYIAAKKLELPEDVFRQEYLAEFLDGEGSVFRNIAACVRNAADIYSLPKYERTYQVGVDLARVYDFTVITVIDDRMRVVALERFNKVDWEYVKLRILAVSSQYHNARVVVDATGVGDPIAQDLIGYGIDVCAVHFKAMDNKKHLIDNLRLRFEQAQLQIPDDPVLLRELEAFRFETSKAGNISYSAPSGFHDDCVISLALALHDMRPHDPHAIKYDQLPEADDSW